MNTKERDFMAEQYAARTKSDPEYAGRFSELPEYEDEPTPEPDPNESTESWGKFIWSWVPGFLQPQG